MDAQTSPDNGRISGDMPPLERIDGALDCGALVICDHAANALPPRYGDLGLPREALERHVGYDIGAAWVARRLAERLGAPAVLSTFSRLLIDANRGDDDPTLVMRISDGVLTPGNARIDAEEIARRRRLYWAPYRQAVATTVEAMLASGEPPAIISIHSFTPVWRGLPRPWKVGLLWDADPRLPQALIHALAAEPDIGPAAVGDNEPYDGALPGDTINAIATARGLSSALIEIRQDLIAERAAAEAWGDRLARVLTPILAPAQMRIAQDWGSRADGREAPATLALSVQA
ncbi:MAG: N-formylglutamate amidohydrolase [Bradyrhizobium sp.]|nr:MAG: N-formylglutamate amidohydrolase [Bradyrhizobium sp.]